jgi:hypothetical protein
MRIVSRQEAIASGATKYFTGEPCAKGHISERYVAGACCQCVSLKKKELYQQNRERVLQYMKVQGALYRKANPDKRSANSAKWKQNNKERVRLLEAIRRDANRQQFRENAKKSYYKHREKNLQRQKEWRQSNKGMVNAFTAERKATILQRTPKWLTKEDKWLIKEAYELAALRSKMFGFAWHVDHIFPLRGKTVSGLHVPENLQVIPEIVNLQKGNRI